MDGFGEVVLFHGTNLFNLVDWGLVFGLKKETTIVTMVEVNCDLN